MADYGSNPGYNTKRGAAEDMYSDAEPSSKSPEQHEEKEEMGETALIPKSLCPDMKPGEEVVLKIVRGLEDQWEVTYAPKKEEGGEHEEGAAEVKPPGGEGSMASMME